MKKKTLNICNKQSSLAQNCENILPHKELWGVRKGEYKTPQEYLEAYTLHENLGVKQDEDRGCNVSVMYNWRKKKVHYPMYSKWGRVSKMFLVFETEALRTTVRVWWLWKKVTGEHDSVRMDGGWRGRELIFNFSNVISSWSEEYFFWV